MMGPQMQFGAQTCQKLKADCCKMSNKLISLRVFFANNVHMTRTVSTLLMPVVMVMHLQKLWDVVDDREDDDGDNVEETVENLSSEFEKENLVINFKTYINGSFRQD